jgi:hypothetical protein
MEASQPEALQTEEGHPPVPQPWRAPASASGSSATSLMMEPEPEPEPFDAAAPGASDEEEWSDEDEDAEQDEGGDEEDFSDEGEYDEDEDGDEGDYDEDEDGGEEEHAFLVNQQADAVSGKVFTRTAEPTKEWRPSHLRPSLFAERPAVCAFGFCMAVDEEMPEGLVPCPPELSRLTFKITQVGFRCVREAFKSGGMIGLAKGS